MHGYSFNKMQAKADKRGVELQTYIDYVAKHAATKKQRSRDERKRLKDELNKQR